MRAESLMRLIRLITHTDPRLREKGADEATDWLSAYSAEEAATLATILSIAAARESDLEALESELHAVLELETTGHVGSAHLGYLAEIDRSTLPIPLRPYITDILGG
ncbi:hypothetical protein [Streptomyces griseosporeus]|uniref:hypothetical protein n=1 Tax=Streptomyces griseosporeus TaxID=1910 RepID=UPI0036FE56C7